MPSTYKQRRAAISDLRRRQERKPLKTFPQNISTETLEGFATQPVKKHKSKTRSTG